VHEPANQHRAGRPPRMSTEEVRTKMLQAGRDAVLDTGLDVGLQSLSFEDLIQLARVSRSAVYREWRHKDKFVDDLLCYVAGPGGHLGDSDAFDQETIDVVREVIADNRHMLGTIDGRRALMHETVRLGAGQAFRATFSPRMRIYTALSAAVGSSQNLQARGKIAAAIEEVEVRSRKAITEMLRYSMETFGLKMRSETLTVEQMQTAGAALIQGLAMRHDVAEAASNHWNSTHGPDVHSPDQIIDTLILRPGLDGKPAEWTLAAVAYLGIVESFVEFDPNFRPKLS
jgi:AcrR family transcriptional regulator